jgi:hypothetical protein
VISLAERKTEEERAVLEKKITLTWKILKLKSFVDSHIEYIYYAFCEHRPIIHD